MSTVSVPSSPSPSSQSPLRKRVSKKPVEAYEATNTQAKESTKLVVAEGSGVKLGGLPHFNAMLPKLPADHDMIKAFHRLLYGSLGTSHNRKANLKKFSGFADAGDEGSMTIRKKKMQDSTVWTLPCLKELLQLLGLEKSGTKEIICDRIISFLASPSKDKMSKVLAQQEEKKQKKKIAAEKKKVKATAEKAKAKEKAAKANKGNKAKVEKKEKVPKRLSGFMIFSKKTRPQIVAANPGIPFGEVGKLVGAEWAKLSEEEKQVYNSTIVMSTVKAAKKKITKPLSGYMVYNKENRSRIVAANPGVAFGDVAKLISAEWKKLSKAEQQVYTDMKVMPKEKEEKKEKKASTGGKAKKEQVAVAADEESELEISEDDDEESQEDGEEEVEMDEEEGEEEEEEEEEMEEEEEEEEE